MKRIQQYFQDVYELYWLSVWYKECKKSLSKLTDDKIRTYKHEHCMRISERMNILKSNVFGWFAYII